MKKIARSYLKILFLSILVWIILIITVNFKAVTDLAIFLKGNLRYVYESTDPIPESSDYKLLHELVNLEQDLTPDERINHLRMLFILKCLDSLEVDYDTIRVPFIYSKSPPHNYNIFIKPNERNDFTLITAHYDNLKIPVYQGALDNSASVAILLNTIRDCKEILKAKNVAFLFTTLEEQGFIGSEVFMAHSIEHGYKPGKVICLDGIGRGDLSAMNNCMGSFGFKFRDYFFREKLFTGYKLKDCPDYQKVDESIINLEKYNINVLKSFLSSTDSRVFVKEGIPALHLTSGDIPHFLKVMHTSRDRIDGLHYESLKKCQEVLCDIVRNSN